MVGAAAALVGIGETLRRRNLEGAIPSTAWVICDQWLGSIFRVLLILLGLAVAAQLIHGDVGLWTVLDRAVGQVSEALLKGGSFLVG